jgi:hypothetical protein
MAKKSAADADPSNTVQIPGGADDRPRLIAQLAVTPSLQGASTIKRWSHVVGDLDVTSLIDELRQQAATASSGDLKRHEAMLAIQAHTLDTIFNELARRSSVNLGEYMEAADRYMRLALKAQSQCRATIETLAEMKNPKPVAFVQQANIANGPQQVNNGADAVPARAEKAENRQNKLLEQRHGERLDVGATGQAVGGDSTLAAVGTVVRAENVEG